MNVTTYRASPTRQCLSGKPQGIASCVGLPPSCEKNIRIFLLLKFKLNKLAIYSEKSVSLGIILTYVTDFCSHSISSFHPKKARDNS